MSPALLLEPPAGVCTYELDEPSLANSIAESERLWEVVNGVIREAEPMSKLATVVAGRLHGRMQSYCEAKQCGEPMMESLFALRAKPRLQRRPDLAFVSRHRWDGIEADEEAAWQVAPELAVEVVSPTNLAEDLEEKVGQYFECGVLRVWVLYPRTRRLHDFTSATTCSIITADGTVEGGEIIPGFRFVVSDLFRGLKPIPTPAVSDE